MSAPGGSAVDSAEARQQSRGRHAAGGGAPAVASSRWIDAARWAAIVGACSVMISPPLANAGIVVMLLCLLASGEAPARLRQAMTQPLAIGAAIVVAAVALGMLWSDAPWSARLLASYTWRKLWIIPIVLALFGPPRWKLRLVAAYVAVCAVAALVSFGLVAVAGRLPTGTEDAAGSLLRNHSSQSMAFAAAAFLSVWLASRPGAGGRDRALAAGAAALFVLNMAFVTPGRSGQLALAVMLAVLAAASLRGWRQVAVVGAAAVLFVGAMAAAPLARDRFALAVHEWSTAGTAKEPSSMGIRATLYENTIELIRERPWFGVGSGGFERAYSAHVQAKYSDWRNISSGDPHNQYLFFLAEQGVFGLLAFLAFIALALADRGDGGRARLAAIGLLLGWCATSLLSSHFQTFAEGHLLAFFLAAMLARPVAGLDAQSAPG